jgi:hypothetical protein
MRRPRVVSIAAHALCFCLGWWLASSPNSPVRPSPVNDRPVLRAVARLTRTAARLGLWLAISADPPPAAKDKARERNQLVQAEAVGDDGFPRVDHADGW